jgi:ribosomal protein S18 acetylase RimI-like enzyme
MFEPFSLHSSSAETLSCLVEPATFSDLPLIAKISSDREGSSYERALKSLKLLVTQHGGKEPPFLLKAVHHQEIVGFSKTVWLEPEISGDPLGLVPGWYLGGVVVSPDFRRRGIGTQLTDARLEAIFRVTESAYYFANHRNKTSIHFHEGFGFQEVKRAIEVPGVTFTNGVGILYSLEKTGYHDQVSV